MADKMLMAQDILNKVFTGTALAGVPSVQDALNAVYDETAGALRINMGAGPVGPFVSRTPVSAPATPNSPGNQGDWAWDGNYLYWCVEADTWVRWVPARDW